MPRRPRGEEALRLLRRYVPRLRWCPSCGLPVLGSERCPRCGGPTLEVKLAPPGDARPAWEEEKGETWRRAVEELGREAAGRLLGGPGAFWLFNPVQAVDAADEVIVDGHTVATRLYAPVAGVWRLRPDRVGVEILCGEELGPYAVVAEKLRPGAVVRPRRWGSGARREPGSYVALCGAGLSYGVGRVLERGDVRVLKAWYRRRRVEWRHRPRGWSVGEVAEANRGWLLEREREAVDWLRGVMESHGDALFLAGLSGGKDSTVSAAVAAEAGVGEAYSVDTGVEHPESLETVDRVAERLGLRLHRAEAGDAFWRGLEAYGPPARDYRWCTRLLKLAPLARLFKTIAGGRRIVMVTGQRGAESPQRAASPRLAESGTLGRGRHLVAAPIQEWSSLEVFLYIALRGLPLNPLYRLGFERIGCYMCPASHLAELRIVARRRPGLWRRWENWLRRYARRAGLPREWVDYGLWRWRLSYPAEVTALIRRLGLRPRELLERAAAAQLHAAREYSGDGEALVLSPAAARPAPGSPREWLYAAGIDAEGDGDAAVARLGGWLLRVDRGRARVELEPRGEPPGPRELRAALGAAAASLVCLRCGLCAEACPTGAFREPGAIDVEKCTRCRACIWACPSSVLADLAAGLLVPGEGRGRRR